MPQLKIVMITMSFCPGNVTPFPGVNRYSVSLANALTSHGAEVSIVTPLLKGNARHDVWNGIEIIRLQDSKTLFGSLGVLGQLNFRTFEFNLLRHAGLLADSDVLHSDIPLPRMKARLRHKPLVAVVHHAYRIWEGLDFLTVPFGVMYQRKALKRADAVVTPSSSAAKDTVESYNVPREKVKVIYHGVDTALFHPSESSGGHSPHQAPILIYVGLLEARKGVGDLVPLFASVSEKVPECELRIVGEGPGESGLRGFFKRWGLSNRVLIRAHLTNEELAVVLNGSDVFVFPSHLEGFGFAVVEAMACGKPVVAYGNETNREIIGDAGILVPDGDLHAFSSSVVNLLQDPVLAAQLGASARKRVLERFNWNSAARQYIELDRRLIRVDSEPLYGFR